VAIMPANPNGVITNNLGIASATITRAPGASPGDECTWSATVLGSDVIAPIVRSNVTVKALN
jgi:hypothetical protein